MNKTIILLIIVHCSLLIPSARHCYSQWVIQNSGTSNHLYDVYFINTQTGWACGNNGAIVKTTNGGNNWFGQTSGVSQPIWSVHFVDSNIGYAVTPLVALTGKVIKTMDGGNLWTIKYETPSRS
ncbi:MAG TPA: YCF48-related protein, partial [Ignavibacteria bacterium]|nr:YCF48-related protein [Ignavibacteria bacterium]